MKVVDVNALIEHLNTTMYFEDIKNGTVCSVEIRGDKNE